MSFFLMVLAGIVLVWSMVWGARWAMEHRRVEPTNTNEGRGDGARQQPALWPDRTGERTKRELGARHAAAPDRGAIVDPGAHAPNAGPAVAPPPGGWPMDSQEIPSPEHPPQ